MRRELESYLSDLSTRTGVDGEALVSFPENANSVDGAEADREKNWRKFISESVLEHPDEEEGRKQRAKVEKGLGRIVELDRKLEEAEQKYQESQRRLKELQIEIGEVLDAETQATRSAPRVRKTSSPPRQGPISPSASRLEQLNGRAAEVGRAVLLTAQEEARVAEILGDILLDEDAETKESGGVSGSGSSAWAEHVYVGGDDPESVRSSEIDDQLKSFNKDSTPAASRTRRLIFSERRNAFVFVDPDQPDAVESKFLTGSGSKAGSKDKRRHDRRKDKGASSKLSEGDGDAKEDVLSSMRRNRVAKIKEKQIDAALAALKDAPLAPVTSHGDTSPRPPQSIRAVVQPVSRGDISRVLSLAKDELASLSADGKGDDAKSDAGMELAGQEQIRQLIEEMGALPARAGSPSPSARTSVLSPQSPSVSSRRSMRSVDSVEDEEWERAGTAARVIRVQPGPNSRSEAFGEDDDEAHFTAVRQKKNSAGSSSRKGASSSRERKEGPAGNSLFAWNANESKPDRRRRKKNRQRHK